MKSSKGVGGAAEVGGLLGGLIGGAIIGAIALSILTDALDRVLRFNVSNSDMYGLVLLFTVPSGLVLGGATGLALALIWLREYKSAGGICIAAGILCVSGFILFFQGDVRDYFSTLLNDSLVFLFAFLWSLILVIFGGKFLHKGFSFDNPA